MIKLRTLGFIDKFSTAQLYLTSYFYVIFKLIAFNYFKQFLTNYFKQLF